MPDLTRRRALLAVAAGAGALAGCASERSQSTPGPRRSTHDAVDYEMRKVRNENGAVVLSKRDESTAPERGPGQESDQEPDQGPNQESGRRALATRGVVLSPADVEQFQFGPATEGEALRSFATATDFDAASLYLLAMPVEACFEIRLQSVTIDREEAPDDLHPHANFCRTYRPADVDCEAGVSHAVGVAIRVSIAAERSTGHGRGMSSSCGPSPRGEAFVATVTPAEGGEDE